MSSEDESIPPESAQASTVQRSGDTPQPPGSTSIEGPEADRIEQANTVIRGSSRVERAEGPFHPTDRTPAAVAQVLLGQHLNQFLLEELIGGGGMGAVFRAHDERLDRTVAIKVIPFVGDDPDLQRRFRNEAQSAAKLDHPRIARVHDAGSHGEWHYIVFEYIEGTNIRDMVTRNGVLPIDDAVYYTSQLAEAIQHAADRGIVHRDIKPSNVLIGANGLIKLVDMGLARSDNLDLSEDMTASGVTLGTFDYISPEQAKDPRDADLRSDIYSLGCTLYFMLTGSPPYPGGTMLQKLLSHGSAPPPNAQDLRADVSDDLVAVLQKMLAKMPDDRYQTASDLTADLHEVAVRDGLSRCESLSPIETRRPKPVLTWLETHAPWVAAAVVLFAVAGWLHLESRATSNEIIISPSAVRPELVDSVADAQTLNEPAASAAGEQFSVDDSTSDGSAFGPPEEPPKYSELKAPAELTEGKAMARPAGDDGDLDIDAQDSQKQENRVQDDQTQDNPAQDNPAPAVRKRDDESDSGTSAVSGENDRASTKTFGASVPHVVRLMDADNAAENGLDIDGAAIATSLPQAFELAAKYGSSRIEIGVPVVYSPPVTVEVDELLVTSTVGGTTIVFQSTESVSADRTAMVALGTHQIEFDDVHFVWDVPQDTGGGTMFSLHDNRLVRLTDCSLTVRNPSEREDVYAFEVTTDPGQLPASRRGSVEDFPTVWVELNNVIVRGEISMMHMDYAAKLLLFWDNGLLAISGRMIDTSGARVVPHADAGPLLLSLTRVTVHAPKGVVRMRIGEPGPYPVSIDRFARKSVFMVDPGIPHFDIGGLSSTTTEQPPLQFRGASNGYAVDSILTDPLLRLETHNGQSAVTRLEDLVANAPAWADETSPKWTVAWASKRFVTLPPSQRLPVDYHQSGMSAPGFDEDSLPILPQGETVNLEVSRFDSPRNTVKYGQL